MGRRFAEFGSVHASAGARSRYAGRRRDTSDVAVVAGRPRSEAARPAGVGRDASGRWGRGPKPAARPHHQVRRVAAAVPPPAKRGGRQGQTAGPPGNGRLLIAPHGRGVPAAVLALSDRPRWAMEILARFGKHVPGRRPVRSACPDGMAIRADGAWSAGRVIHLGTQRPPTARTAAMRVWHSLGGASAAGLLAHLAERTGRAQA